jgi:hypothetical protein
MRISDYTKLGLFGIFLFLPLTTTQAIVGRDNLTPVAGSFTNPADPYNTLGQQFSFVGLLGGTTGTNSSTSSAVLIDSLHIITAAHTVTGVGYGVSNTTAYTPEWVRFSNGEPGGFTQYGIASVTSANIHPNWQYATSTSDWLGSDLAVLTLTQAVTGVAPVGLYTGNGEIGQNAALVGLGNWGNGITGANNPSLSSTGQGTFLVKAGTNVIDGTSSLLTTIPTSYGNSGTYPFSGDYLVTDFDHPNGSTNALPGSSAIATDLEAGVASGDSGGALLLQESGAWKLAGIAAEIALPLGDSNPDYGYGEISGFQRVSPHVRFIDSVTGQSHLPTPTPPPLPTPPPPLPTPIPVIPTPTPDPIVATPTPVPIVATPTPTPILSTPTPEPIIVMPTPEPIITTPIPILSTPTPEPASATPVPGGTNTTGGGGNQVPEPGTLALVGAVLGVMPLALRRRLSGNK